MLSDADLASFVAKTYALKPDVWAGDNVRAMFLERGGEFVIGVPGTTDLDGWLRDFSAWPLWFDTIGLCHAGFGSGGQALWQLVKPKIPRTKRIIYAGHSLGGALAQVLGAMHAAEMPSLPFEVVTFGSPRVALCCNPLFHWLLGKALRIELYARRGDPIPDVPFKPLYLHHHRLDLIGEPVPGSENLKGDFDLTNHAINLYSADLRAAGL